LFEAQPQEYRDAVLPPAVRARVAIEAAEGLGWCRYVGDKGAVLSIERFGASAPYQVIYEKFGLTPANVVAKARACLRS
ncbi:MAG: transketolase, partial [Anaerolineae bacterium]